MADLVEESCYHDCILSETSAKKPKSEVEKAVSFIQDVSKENGLEPDVINALMNFVTGTGSGGVFYLVANSSAKLILHLGVWQINVATKVWI